MSELVLMLADGPLTLLGFHDANGFRVDFDTRDAASVAVRERITSHCNAAGWDHIPTADGHHVTMVRWERDASERRYDEINPETGQWYGADGLVHYEPGPIMRTWWAAQPRETEHE